MDFPDRQQQSNQEYASMPAPLAPVPDVVPASDELSAAQPPLDPSPDHEPAVELNQEPGAGTETETDTAGNDDLDPVLPTMSDLRSVATDLDDIDDILARLDDDESALDDRTGQTGQPDQTGSVTRDDPEDQDPLLATR